MSAALENSKIYICPFVSTPEEKHSSTEKKAIEFVIK